MNEQSITMLFAPRDNVDPREYAAYGLSQTELDAIRVPSAMGWRHFLHMQGLGFVSGTFDLKRTADVLTSLAWTPSQFLELLDDICDEVGDDPAVSLRLLDRRLLVLLSKLKDAS